MSRSSGQPQRMWLLGDASSRCILWACLGHVTDVSSTCRAMRRAGASSSPARHSLLRPPRARGPNELISNPYSFTRLARPPRARGPARGTPWPCAEACHARRAAAPSSRTPLAVHTRNAPHPQASPPAAQHAPRPWREKPHASCHMQPRAEPRTRACGTRFACSHRSIAHGR